MNRQVGLIVLAAGLASSKAFAQPSFSASPPCGSTGAGSVTCTRIFNTVTQKYDFYFNTSWTADPTTFTISGSSSDQVGVVYVENTAVGQTTFLRIWGSGGSSTPIGSVDRVEMTASSTRPVIVQEMWTIGDLGSMRATRFLVGRIGGSTTGNLELVAVGGLAPLIDSVRASGSILGNVVVSGSNGIITDLRAVGDIGTASVPVNIWADHDIFFIQGRSIYANVQANRGGSGGVLAGLYTTGASPNGDFVGSASAFRIPTRSEGSPAISISRDLDANITLTGAGTGTRDILSPIVVARDFKSGRTLSTSGSLIDDATNEGRISVHRNFAGTITLGSPSNNTALKGQIFINRDAQTGTWTGTVNVGTRTINDLQSSPNTAPYYQALPADLGGGAIGLVRFNNHGEASQPKHQGFHTEILGQPSTRLSTVYIEHYGRVDYTGNAGQAQYPVVIQRRPRATPDDPWQTLSGASFNYSIGTINPRRLVITVAGGGWFDAEYEYRITPVTDYLRSIVVNEYTNPATLVNVGPVRDYEYRFTVISAAGGGGD
jgi:hypothetical protein